MEIYVICLFFYFSLWRVSAVPRDSEDGLRPFSHATLEVLAHNTTCSSSQYLVNLKFNRPFGGIVYAKGYPYTKIQKQEERCYSNAPHSDSMQLKLKTNSCGVRLISKDGEQLLFVVTVVVQSDKFLQQISNFEVTTSCQISAAQMAPTDQLRNHRTGKGLDVTASESFRRVKAWMEIDSNDGEDHVMVGDTLHVFVKTLLPGDISPCVTSCFAYDGLRERTENLTDVNGCTYDPSLVPSLIDLSHAFYNTNLVPHQAKSSVRVALKVSGTSFPAFKFADTTNLHLKCTLSFYKHSCPYVTCGEKDHRVKRSAEHSSMLGQLDVFNSIEVLAPGIDTDVYKIKQDLTPSDGRKICLSTIDIAIHLALLGGIIFILSFVIFFIYWRSSQRKMADSSSYSGSSVVLVQRNRLALQTRGVRNPYTFVA